MKLFPHHYVDHILALLHVAHVEESLCVGALSLASVGVHTHTHTSDRLLRLIQHASVQREGHHGEGGSQRHRGGAHAHAQLRGLNRPLQRAGGQRGTLRGSGGEILPAGSGRKARRGTRRRPREPARPDSRRASTRRQAALGEKREKDAPPSSRWRRRPMSASECLPDLFSTIPVILKPETTKSSVTATLPKPIWSEGGGEELPRPTDAWAPPTRTKGGRRGACSRR